MRAACGVEMHGDATPSLTVQGATLGDVRRTRSLQVQSLNESDIAKVATFLRVGRGRLQCDWEIVFGGELDVLMLGGDEPDTVVGLLDGPLATLRVVDRGADLCDAAGVLIRPLQYDAFVDALSALERGVAGGSHAAATKVAPAVAGAIPSDAHFRLRRWPPSVVLQEHRYHVRLASCMSVRHVGIDELVRLSNVGRPHCEEFLATLIAKNMLDVRPVTATPAPPVTGAAAPRPAVPVEARSVPDTGLFGKIRRRLGLTLLR